jgi:hypothetical protein
MPAWVVMRESTPVCVVFNEAEAAGIVAKDQELLYSMVSMGSHPSVAAMDFQMQQTQSWRWKAQRFERVAKRLDALHETARGDVTRLTKRLALLSQLD